MADEVAAFADGLGLDRPHVAGNSMGGGLALALGARGRVRSACAISPIGFANPREAAYARGVLATTRFLARGVAPVAPAVAGNPVLRTMLSSHVAARPWRIPADDTVLWTRAYAHAPSFWPLLRSAPSWSVEPPVCPATIAWGDHDRLLIYSRQAPRARRRLPEARHITLRGCGHVPTWDDPEAVAAAILA
jgi:pimeloyl-ACP methyl ester carboxylesterase